MKVTTVVTLFSAVLYCAAAESGPGVGTAQAAVGDQIAKLTASDAAIFDQFGSSVAISDNTALVGAPYDDHPGENYGSAYLFDATTGEQLAKLIATDAAARDVFGDAVAISGNTALVGAPGDDDNGNASGSAYLFDATTGQQLAKLTASDAAAEDIFGFSVAISGNTALVGAPEDAAGGEYSGSVYLFDVSDPLNPVELRKLTASDASTYNWFGWSVSISGGLALVGARGEGETHNIGSAYVFDVMTGEELAKLAVPDAEVSDHIGWTVAISGELALVGAFGDGDDASGSAYLFDATTGDLLAKLTASDAAAVDYFGRSVAISGDTALVGAALDDDNGDASGSAYLFDVSDPFNPVQIGKLTASDGSEGDIFGKSVAISSNTALVGAYFDGDAGRESGSAYLFSTVPEPASMALAAAGMLVLAVRHRLH